MALVPEVHHTLTIDKVIYRFTPHPAIPSMPYGQSGKRATVYQVEEYTRLHALKIFIPTFRTTRTAENADRLRSFARMPGLEACQRIVLTPQRHAELIRTYPELTYAVLMPWVQGQTWQELHLDEELEFTQSMSRIIAQCLVRTLAMMEQSSVAHCDLSGPNVIVALQGSTASISLIDVEDLYAPQIPEPKLKPGGSAGYAHPTAPKGLWSPVADRFAAAVLLGEILGWCDPRVRKAAYGEQYFHPDMHTSSENSARLRVLLEVLHERWGVGKAQAFARAWNSAELSDCPPIREWAQMLGVQDLGAGVPLIARGVDPTTAAARPSAPARADAPASTPVPAAGASAPASPVIAWRKDYISPSRAVASARQIDPVTVPAPLHKQTIPAIEQPPAADSQPRSSKLLLFVGMIVVLIILFLIMSA